DRRKQTLDDLEVERRVDVVAEAIAEHQPLRRFVVAGGEGNDRGDVVLPHQAVQRGIAPGDLLRDRDLTHAAERRAGESGGGRRASFAGSGRYRARAADQRDVAVQGVGQQSYDLARRAQLGDRADRGLNALVES